MLECLLNESSEHLMENVFKYYSLDSEQEKAEAGSMNSITEQNEFDAWECLELRDISRW